jgi:hypothetical protein
MDGVNGKSKRMTSIATDMKVNILWTKNKVLEYLCGNQETNIGENMITMKEKVLVK